LAQPGYIALVEGRTAEAIPFLKSALSAEWYDDEDGFRFGNSMHLAALVKTGRYEEAVQVGKVLMARWPDTPDIRFNLAQSLERLGYRQEALQEYRSLIERCPDYQPARQAIAHF
jgi:tetratricopeptide (TPR) repeat protein